jgi:hypothetical protein
VEALALRAQLLPSQQPLPFAQHPSFLHSFIAAFMVLLSQQGLPSFISHLFLALLSTSLPEGVDSLAAASGVAW